MRKIEQRRTGVGGQKEHAKKQKNLHTSACRGKLIPANGWSICRDRSYRFMGFAYAKGFSVGYNTPSGWL